MLRYFLVIISFIFVKVYDVTSQSIAFHQEEAATVVANSDFVSMGEGATEVINVLNNDYGLLSGVKELVITLQPQNATVSIVNFNVVYTPDEDFIGTDEFKYRVCNNDGECDEATVTVVVEDVDFMPIANKDFYSIEKGQVLSAEVLKNDNGLYDKPINLSVITELHNGTSSVDGDLLINIHFNTGFTGKDSIQYEVCDVEGDCDQAWVIIEVIGDGKETIFIPQGISPNGDGLNDKFFVPDLEGLPLEIVVFDNAGVIVYKSTTYENDWEGRSNISGRDGEILPKGHYYYVLKVKQTNREYSGFIYLNY